MDGTLQHANCGQDLLRSDFHKRFMVSHLSDRSFVRDIARLTLMF